jgi:proline racemase
MPKKVLITVDTHTAGEPTRIVIGGLPHIPGKTMADKKKFLEKNFDFIRKALMLEPRGHSNMFGAVITAPAGEADLGVIFMDCHGWQDMCGHGSLAVATIAVELGLINPIEPVTTVTLDTPAGLVKGYVRIENGSVKSTAIHNVPSFHYKTLCINMPKLGKIPVDIAFGGNFFAIVNANNIGIKLKIENIPKLVEIGRIIKETVNKKVEVQHPGKKTYINYVQNVRIFEATHLHDMLHIKNVVLFASGRSASHLQVDRSPCGTGTSAHIATLYAKNQLKLNEESVHESIIGTIFRGKAIKETMVGDYKAVITEISCKTYITGINHWFIDPNDPFKYGFFFSIPI